MSESIIVKDPIGPETVPDAPVALDLAQELVDSIIASGQPVMMYDRSVIMAEAEFTALMFSLGMAKPSKSE